MIAFTNGGLMLRFIYIKIIKQFKTQIFKFRLKYNSNKRVYSYTTQSVYLVRSNYLKKKSKFIISSRSFCSGNIKLKANTFESIKDLTNNLKAESSADAARRITRNPNPNRIRCLVKRIFSIFIESDLDTKINSMDNLLSEDF
jgi:hypothetical protein